MNIIQLTANPQFGAELSGVDLKRTAHERGTETRYYLAQLLHERLALVFREQELTNDDLMAVAAIFGHMGQADPWIAKHRSHNYPDSEYPYIRTVSAELTDPASSLWHADRLYRPEAPDFLILYGLSVDPGAESTDIMSMRALWSRLSSTEQTTCGESRMSHSSRPKPGLTVDARYRVEKRAECEFERPLRFTDPHTGEDAVCVTDYHDNFIVGMPRDEGNDLIESIYAHTSDEDRLNHKWSVGDLVVFDNRSTNHRRGSGDGGTRVLKRLQGFYYPS